MSKENKSEIDTEIVKEIARNAVERSDDIRHDVRTLTLKALSDGRLDTKKINKVIRAVMEGVSIGVEDKGEQAKDALSDAMSGMDDALAKSAEASKLAVEEAAGHIKDFSSHDLKRAMDDLLGLEELFFDSVRDVSKGTSETVKGTLSDLVKHAKQNGTNVGKTTSDAASSLNQKLSNTLKDTASAGIQSTADVLAHIANASAGILEGIADTLQKENKKKSDKE